VALPMILVGAGQRATLGPLTAAGIARVEPRDAGAASGLVNVAHQLGGSLGLGILVAVLAAATAHSLDAPHLFAHRVGVALTVGAAMLALALLPGPPADRPTAPDPSQRSSPVSVRPADELTGSARPRTPVRIVSGGRSCRLDQANQP
jgi:hypothetical protein